MDALAAPTNSVDFQTFFLGNGKLRERAMLLIFNTAETGFIVFLNSGDSICFKFFWENKTPTLKDCLRRRVKVAIALSGLLITHLA